MISNYTRSVSIVMLLCAMSLGMIAQTKPTPEQQYQSMLEQYNQGKGDPQFLQNLAWMALKRNDHKTADKIVSHFYNDSSSIDQTMGTPGYSEHFLDRVISLEEVRPLTYPAGKLSTSEPDWQAITAAIEKRCGTNCAERIVLSAKADWSYQQADYITFAKFIDDRLAKYPARALSGMDGDVWILNVNAWNMFIQSSDKRVLSSALNWDDLSLKLDAELTKNDKNGDVFPPEAAILDTKANLLYKLGRTDEAISLEEQAVVQAEKIGMKDWVRDFAKTVEVMKIHEPTWRGSFRPDIPR